MKPVPNGNDIVNFSEVQREFLLFLQDRYSPKAIDKDLYQKTVYSELKNHHNKFTNEFYEYEIFEDEWKEIMNNMDIYTDYYFKNETFRNRFDEWIKDGKMRGWTKEGKIKLEKAK